MRVTDPASRMRSGPTTTIPLQASATVSAATATSASASTGTDQQLGRGLHTGGARGLARGKTWLAQAQAPTS